MLPVVDGALVLAPPKLKIGAGAAAGAVPPNMLPPAGFEGSTFIGLPPKIGGAAGPGVDGGNAGFDSVTAPVVAPPKSEGAGFASEVAGFKSPPKRDDAGFCSPAPKMDGVLVPDFAKILEVPASVFAVVPNRLGAVDVETFGVVSAAGFGVSGAGLLRSANNDGVDVEGLKVEGALSAGFVVVPNSDGGAVVDGAVSAFGAEPKSVLAGVGAAVVGAVVDGLDAAPNAGRLVGGPSRADA